MRVVKRVVFVVLAAITIAAGLAVHFAGGMLPNAIRDFLGDALWASMIFWGVGAIAPTRPRTTRASLAVAICFAVEFSQLYHTPQLDHIRVTTLGHLVLGNDFDPRDLLAYAAGVLVAGAVEHFGLAPPD